MITKIKNLHCLEIQLPQPDISSQTSPERTLIISIKLSNLLSRQCSVTRNQVSCCWIAPRCPKNDLVCDGCEHNQKQADGVRKEVVNREVTASLWNSILLDCRIERVASLIGTFGTFGILGPHTKGFILKYRIQIKSRVEITRTRHGARGQKLDFQP